MSVKIEHLEHIYAQGSPFAFKALDDVTVTLDSGAFIALIGHTGSGKSTLIQHLNGLLTPTAGTVYLGDKDVWQFLFCSPRFTHKRHLLYRRTK